MWHNSHSYAGQERQNSGGKCRGQQSGAVKAWSSSQPLNRAQVHFVPPPMLIGSTMILT